MMTEPNPDNERRRAAMAVLTHAATSDVAVLLKDVGIPPYERLRASERGLVMVRGRIGGDGAPFNLGEATVSRAAVRLASGEVGFGYVLGRDGEKATLIALCDAMIQSPLHHDAVEREVIVPLRTRMLQARANEAAKTAATRVDFYTMVRGEG